MRPRRTGFRVTPTADLDEFAQALLAIGQYFGMEPTQERMERFSRNLPLERMHAAREDGRIVGGAGAFPFELTVPGATIAAAGVTVVGTYPTHRRRGVLRTLMRTQLDDVREREEAIGILWASEETIYGRFGYGMASLTGEMSLPTEYASFAAPVEHAGRIRLVEHEEALRLFPKVWDAVRGKTPGMLARSAAWWETRTLFDAPEWRAGAGPKRFVVLEQGRRPVGYAIYRHKPKWEDGISDSELVVVEAIAVEGQPTAEIWRYLLDIDWAARVHGELLPADHPLFFLLATPRRMRFRVGDGLWVRLVDVGAALSARGYAADGAVVFEVTDEFCPWNTGRWRLTDGTAKRTSASAQIRCDVTALGSVYLGGFTFAELARAGRVVELRRGAVARADAMFRTDRAPWCPEIF